MVRRSLLAVTMLLSLVPAWSQEAMTPEAKVAWDNGYALTQKGEYREALKAYERGVALSPKAGEIWSEYALCLRKVHRLARSLHAGWTAVALTPGVSDPWNNQGNTFIEAGAWDAAARCLDRAATLNPDKAWVARAYLALAYPMWWNQRPQDALKVMEKAIAADPANGLALVDKGGILYFMDTTKAKEAKKFVERGIELLKKKDSYGGLQYAYGILEKVESGQQWTGSWTPELSRQKIPEALASQPAPEVLAAVPLPSSVEREYSLPRGDSFSITTPESWWERLGKVAPLHLNTIEYEPLERDGTLVLLSVRYAGEGDPEVKREVELKLEASRDHALEKEIPLLPVGSGSTRGYAFLATDKGYDPKKEGDYPSMLSASVESGPLRFHVTVLLHSSDDKTVKPLLEVLGSLRHIARAPVPSAGTSR